MAATLRFAAVRQAVSQSGRQAGSAARRAAHARTWRSRRRCRVRLRARGRTSWRLRRRPRPRRSVRSGRRRRRPKRRRRARRRARRGRRRRRRCALGMPNAARLEAPLVAGLRGWDGARSLPAALRQPGRVRCRARRRRCHVGWPNVDRLLPHWRASHIGCLHVGRRTSTLMMPRTSCEAVSHALQTMPCGVARLRDRGCGCGRGVPCAARGTRSVHHYI